ncbi:hypothetical protein EDD21DRAFT_357238 [Dissophora ornata]|nr:hypothetical protein EDD21DRAFT_357238 [Dissophora ornata]
MANGRSTQWSVFCYIEYCDGAENNDRRQLQRSVNNPAYMPQNWRPFYGHSLSTLAVQSIIAFARIISPCSHHSSVRTNSSDKPKDLVRMPQQDLCSNSKIGTIIERLQHRTAHESLTAFLKSSEEVFVSLGLFGPVTEGGADDTAGPDRLEAALVESEEKLKISQDEQNATAAESEALVKDLERVRREIAEARTKSEKDKASLEGIIER